MGGTVAGLGAERGGVAEGRACFRVIPEAGRAE